MTDFDPDEFSTDPGEDYRALLDVIRQAAADGVKSGTAATEQWAKQIDRNLAELRQIKTDLVMARMDLWWSQVWKVLFFSIAGTIILAGAGMGYHWIKEPKVEKQAYGCTRWDAKAQTCKGQWILLQTQN